MRLGLITIGQSPRSDVVPEMRPYIKDVEIFELGALDGLSLEEIKKLHPKEGEPVLVSRLRDGTQVKLNGNIIAQRLKECVKRLENEVDIIGLLCTGEFKELRSNKILIEPSLILTKVVEALNVERLGVLIPEPEQEEMTLRKWDGKAKEILISSVSPYTGREEDFLSAGEKLKNCDMVVLDCIGYNLKVKSLIGKITERPVLLPRTLMARVIGELLER
ncbi:MAG: AroM family protein [Synergistetes bacterium]|nr:AroM family protein [Synergistota bacterium]MDW8192389.1 AroM family protein [Synergistota bacterium]